MAVERDAALQRLLDESDLRALIARYARTVDHQDWQGLRTCYWPDATDAHGAHNGDIDDFIENSVVFHSKIDSMTHVMGQSSIAFGTHGPDTAWMETYCLCYVRYVAGAMDELPTDRISNIRYVDICEKRGAEWRVKNRKVVHHPTALWPLGKDATLAAKALQATHGMDDPSYDVTVESFFV